MPALSKKNAIPDYLEVVPPAKKSPVDVLAPTIFHEAWWLDIACKGDFKVIEYSDHGKVVGRLPYYSYRKYGFTITHLPPLTHFLGPAVIEGEGKPSTKFLRRLEITSALIRQIPRHASFYIKCHRDINEVIAFQNNGFRTCVQFTNELQPQPADALWDSLRPDARNSIRSARDKYVAVKGDDPARFMDFYTKNIKAKGLKNNMDAEVCTRLVTACLERRRGQIIEARESDGTIAAAVFCAWDSTSCYGLMMTQKEGAHRGAVKFIIWESILEAFNRNLIFDFDGVSSEATARVANDFTVAFMPRYTVLRESAPMRALRALQSTFREENCYF